MTRIGLALVFCLLPVWAHAQTTLMIPFLSANFAWDVPTPDATHSAPRQHVVVCGDISVAVPMPATSIPVRSVVPGPGVYDCSLYAVNDFGRQAEPNVPFPSFQAGNVPMPSTHPRLEVQ